MNDHVVLGMHDDWGYEKQIVLSSVDRRQHLYAIGKSGTGKTTLLRNLILQDIAAGRGVGVIDPHGDLAADILDHIPRHRTEDVVFFDPSDLENPPAVNLVGQVPQDRRHLVASGVVSAFKGIWGDSWGPRMEYILYAAVAAILDCENVSLLGVQRMLSDARYRSWVVKQIKDSSVRAFWEREFATYDKRFMQEAVAPIQNKIGQLLMSPPVRNLLGQVKGRIDARFMMDNRRIFIASLPKGKLGPITANLLGSLLVTQFQLAAMSRADIAESERRDFYLYVDEFHSFVSDSFTSILSEARKYRLCLTLAHQYLGQLKPEIADAVMGNVGSIVCFRVGHEDAKAIEQTYGGIYAAGQFSSLSNGEIYAKLLTRGEDAAPFLGRTVPPSGTRHGRAEQIVQRSRERFTRPRREIERKLEQWMSNR